MNILSYFKHPGQKSYFTLKRWAGLVLYFTYLVVLAVRVLSQFNKIGEKPAILRINTFFALFLPSIYILLSAYSIHYLLMDKEYKKDTRKIRITSYSLSFISNFLAITMQIISLAAVSTNMHGDINSSISRDFFSFIGVALSLFIFYPINIYCRNHDCKDSKSLEEAKKHKKIMGILLVMLVLEVMFLVGKIISVTEREGYFIVEDKIMNLGNDITYYFNFSTTIAIVCMLIMTGLSTFRMVIENKIELRDSNIAQAIVEYPTVS